MRGVRVELTCQAEEPCHASVVLEMIYLRLTKRGVLRLMGNSRGWYVDGALALCPRHLPDPLPSPQRETWSEYDEARRSIANEEE